MQQQSRVKPPKEIPVWHGKYPVQTQENHQQSHYGNLQSPNSIYSNSAEAPTANIRERYKPQWLCIVLMDPVLISGQATPEHRCQRRKRLCPMARQHAA